MSSLADAFLQDFEEEEGQEEAKVVNEVKPERG